MKKRINLLPRAIAFVPDGCFAARSPFSLQLHCLLCFSCHLTSRWHRRALWHLFGSLVLCDDASTTSASIASLKFSVSCTCDMLPCHGCRVRLIQSSVPDFVRTSAHKLAGEMAAAHGAGLIATLSATCWADFRSKPGPGEPISLST